MRPFDTLRMGGLVGEVQVGFGALRADLNPRLRMPRISQHRPTFLSA